MQRRPLRTPSNRLSLSSMGNTKDGPEPGLPLRGVLCAVVRIGDTRGEPARLSTFCVRSTSFLLEPCFLRMRRWPKEPLDEVRTSDDDDDAVDSVDVLEFMRVLPPPRRRDEDEPKDESLESTLRSDRSDRSMRLCCSSTSSCSACSANRCCAARAALSLRRRTSMRTLSR